MENNDRDEFFDLPEPAPAPAPSPAPAPAPKRKGKALRITAIVLGVLLVAAAAFYGGWVGRYYSLGEEVRTYLWARELVKNNYYRPIDDEELDAMLYDSLAVDEYSEFYSAEEMQSFFAKNAGESAGVGLSFFIEQDPEDLGQVFSVPENSPASRAGIRKGMYVIAFGETEDAMTEGNYAQFASFLAKQKIGTPFYLRCGYDRGGEGAKNYPVSREEYQTSYLHYRDSESSFRFTGEGETLSLTETFEPLQGLDEKTAYLRFDAFEGKNTDKEIVECLTTMKERGRSNLIIDLRSNGGGDLSKLGILASHLMRNAEGRQPVVLIGKPRNGRAIRYVCDGNDFGDYFGETSSVYLLADEYTASASEALMGVLLDYGTCSFDHVFLRRGENGVAKTFGKGIMQTFLLNANGSAMKLTTATVHWPVTERCIHDVGITEKDGAIGIDAPLVWGETDPMLEEVISRVCG